MYRIFICISALVNLLCLLANVNSLLCFASCLRFMSHQNKHLAIVLGQSADHLPCSLTQKQTADSVAASTVLLHIFDDVCCQLIHQSCCKLAADTQFLLLSSTSATSPRASVLLSIYQHVVLLHVLLVPGHLWTNHEHVITTSSLSNVTQYIFSFAGQSAMQQVPASC